MDDDGTGTYVSKGSDGGDQSTHNSTFDINNSSQFTFRPVEENNKLYR